MVLAELESPREPKMSNYSTLDAHSRNCSACIKQRDTTCSSGEWRKPSGSGSGHHQHQRKKISLQAEPRKSSASSPTSMLRRSNSCLSSSSMTGSLREEGAETSTYLTPTQRKNMEIKNIRLELERTKAELSEKDREILILRKEVAALKESQSASRLEESWAAVETESVGDSGNCEELGETTWETSETPLDTSPETHIDTNQEGNNMENFEFELMESALKEEEEYRHKLETDNQELSSQVSDLEEQLVAITEKYENQLQVLRQGHDEDVLEARKESQAKVEELIIELAESSMRCARQQDAIEQKQLRLDQLAEEADQSKRTIITLTELSQAKQSTKDITKDCDPVVYLNLVTVSSQTELNSGHSGTQTEPLPALPPPPQSVDTMDSVEAVLATRPDSKKSEESTCDNNIHFTYQFLRRSIYYYITDKENRAYHLRSIQRLLEFSDAELSISPPRPVQHKRY